MEFQIFGWGGVLMCAAYFLAGVFDASCGGGGLIVLPAFLAIGFPAHYILGTNNCIMILGTVTSLAKFAKEKMVHWRSALMAVPFTVIGAFIGAQLNLLMSEEILKKVMIVLIPVIAVLTVLKRDIGKENRITEISDSRMFLNSALIGLVLGTYQAFYGAGTGTFLMLAFAALDRLDLVTASGNTKVAVLAANLTAAATYAASGAVMWSLVLFAIAFNVAGNWLGASLAVSKGSKFIRPMYYIILALLFARLVFRLF